jgi:hypothetical protein
MIYDSAISSGYIFIAVVTLLLHTVKLVGICLILNPKVGALPETALIHLNMTLTLFCNSCSI